MEYDDIIVGAGSSGVVSATRLSEDAWRPVLLLEAGPDYPDLDQTPDDLQHSFISVGPHDWGLVAKATANREIPYPRGKVTGGCSAINASMAIRGAPQDFEEWTEWGNPDWSFAQVLPFYRKLEHDLDFDGDYHGIDGPILIERPPARDWQPLEQAFYAACRRLGFADVADHNGPSSTGVGPWPRNRHDRVRVSTAIGCLGPSRNRLNLTILAQVNVHRVLVQNGRAVGVEAECGGSLQSIRGRRVTLSAGAIGSPVILMRSGIGPRSELERLDIRPVADLPGVGKNLTDHSRVVIVAQPIARFVHDHDKVNSLGVRYTAQGSHEFNDMLLAMVVFCSPELAPGSVWPLPLPVFAIFPVLVRPRSRGSVKLKSAEPGIAPEIFLNFMNDPEDMRRMKEGVRLAWCVLRDNDVVTFVKEVVGLKEEVIGSDPLLEKFIHDYCTTIFHPVGTAKMGPESDPMAVVDQHCRVRGVAGLRVVDASVMPNIVRAPTNLTSIMIGERVADWMKESE